MRSDFDDVIRVGKGGRKSRKDKSSRSDRADTPLEDKTKKNPYYHRHENTLIGPINKYLDKQVGRKWDDVWSEICTANDIRSKPKPYIFDYIDGDYGWGAVEKNPIFGEDGKIYCASGRHEITGGRRRAYYVDPESGLLCKVDPKPKVKKQKLKNYVVLDDYHQFHKVKGIWYLVTFESWDTSIVADQKDILMIAERSDPEFLADQSEQHRNRSYRDTSLMGRYGAWIYAVRKQQASKRDIRWVEQQLEIEQKRAERS